MAGRTLFLLVSLVSLYLLLPSLLEVFTSWRELFGLAPEWFAIALGAEALSFVAIWEVQRIALQTGERLPVSLSQLTGNAVARIIPGGAATAGALQYRMLLRAGLPGGRIAPALAGASILLFGTVLALPLLSLPAILAGTPVEPGLAEAAALGAGLFVVVLAAGVTVFVWDRPLVLAGAAIEAVLNRTARRGRPVGGLADRLLQERDALRRAFGRRWRAALLA